MSGYKYSRPKPLSKTAVFDIIHSPLVTEKATLNTEVNNVVVFRVAMDSTKPQIKQAVEEIFGVKVQSVNTLRVKGKSKIFRGRPGRRSDIKKAYVKLAQGHSIDVMTGLTR